MNISQFRDQSEALKQLWRVNYLGDGEYAIRSMQNPSLVMAMSNVGVIERNVMAYNLGTSNDNLPDRAQWYFRGTTYSMFTEATVESTTYRLAVAAGDTSDYSNIYAITTGGSGAASWRLVEIETALEGVVIYSGNTNATGRTYSMNIGDNKLFTAIFYTAGPDATQSFTWTTGNSAVATVDSSGRVYATGTGTTVITATSTVDVRRSAYFYVTVGADTDFDGISDASDSEPYTNTFTGTLKTDKTESTVSYTIDYRTFLNPTTTYNATLCQLSSLVSTIVYSGRTFTDEDTNQTSTINGWMSRHGMLGGTMDTNDNMDYTTTISSSDDHVSEVALGYRPIVSNAQNRIVVAVIIRGTNTSLKEWSSNTDVGNTDNFANYPDWTNPNHHMGFDITSNRIFDKVTKFVNDNISSNSQYNDFDLVYWVTGHSRGGALANLVAAKLIDRGESVFAYTFAAPGTVVCSRCRSYGYDECEQSTGCTAHASKYSSIFNIINEDDFLPYFPLKQWYFTLYGRTTQGIRISGTNESGWIAQFGITEYMHMASPSAPLDQLALVASSRNDCYDYRMDATGMAELEEYPSNTEGYYLTSGLVSYQSSMFLMKYFAAVAAKDSGVTGYDFALLNVAPYLEQVKLSVILNIPELEVDLDNASIDTNLDRVFHPHLPETYQFISIGITESAFQ